MGQDARWVPQGPPRENEKITTPAAALAGIAADKAARRANRKSAT